MSRTKTTANPIAIGTIIAAIGPKDKVKQMPGWLICNGQQVAKSDYESLWEAIQYSYGGKGEVFNLPDLRGQFLRGVDDTDDGKFDPGRGKRTTKTGEPLPSGVVDWIGTRQTHQLLSHQHSWDKTFGNIYWRGYPGIGIQLTTTSPGRPNMPTGPATNLDGGGERPGR